MGSTLEGSPCTSLQSQFEKKRNKNNFGTIALFVPITLGLLASLLPLLLHLAVFPCLLSLCQSPCPASCFALGLDGLWAFSVVTFNTCIHIAFPPSLEILILGISDNEPVLFCSLGAQCPSFKANKAVCPLSEFCGGSWVKFPLPYDLPSPDAPWRHTYLAQGCLPCVSDG